MTTLMRKPAMLAAAIAAAAVLAFGVLCAAPASAVADDGSLSATDGAALSAQEDLSTQATVKIPVITKMVSKTEMYVYGKGIETVTDTFTVKYNAKGQVKSYKESTKSSEGTDWSSRAYSFNKKGNMKTCKFENSYGDANTYEYVLDKKGRVKKIKDSDTAYKYSAKGYIAKVVGKNNSFTWNNEGLLQKMVCKGSSTSTYSFTYDSKGNFTEKQYQTSYGTTITFTYANTYDGDLLKERVETNDDGDAGYTTTYTYKTIEVPEAFAAQVKAQQKWLKYQNTTYDYQFPPLETMYL